MMKRRTWYVAHELLCFQPEGKTRQKRAKWTVWENLILTEARSPEEAFRKAVARGHQNEGPVKINGQHGYCRFMGLRELTFVYDELEDGAELEWRVFELDRAALGRLVTAKQKLQAFGPSSKKIKTRGKGAP